jgi:hypothetical protein
MAIPKRSEIKPVILAVLADGKEHTTDESQALAVGYFRLTTEELGEQAGNGHGRFQNEHAWALSLLVQDRMIQLVDDRTGSYSATGIGLAQAKSNDLTLDGGR